jgi:N-acetylmuramoyl-L-alanine amidase
MRRIDHIVIHCTATAKTAKVEAIQAYWKRVRGWDKPGYHVIIKADGEAVRLLDDAIPSNGVAGQNSRIINICYIGGIDVGTGKAKDTRTPEQTATMIRLLKEYKVKFPNATILGHRDFPNVAKACPSFDVRTWINSIEWN